MLPVHEKEASALGGLGAGLGDYPNTIQGSLPNTHLGFWALGQGNLGFRGG